LLGTHPPEPLDLQLIFVVLFCYLCSDGPSFCCFLEMWTMKFGEWNLSCISILWELLTFLETET
jgi:hypothetical protein